MAANFEALSPHDFELLVGDLYAAVSGHPVETFMTGPDSGIDVRLMRGGSTDIIQCKHYARSGFSKLVQVLEDEKAKIDEIQPDRFIVATTVPLNPQRKHTLIQLLDPWVRAPGDIWGADDIAGLLRANPEVEKSHFKLWLNSTAVLERVLHNEILVRTESYVEDLRRKLKIYVTNESLSRARTILEEHHVLIISGAPGVGKTTLADVLLAAYVSDEFSPTLVSVDVNEVDRLYQKDRRQIFLYDDFLGRSSSLEKLARREDDRLLLTMRRITSSETKRLIMTTRDYLIEQAKTDFERLDSHRVDLVRLVLDVGVYTRFARAHILYNHLYYSDLPDEHLAEVVRTRVYRALCDHDNYVPRLIEDAVDLATIQEVAAEEFPDFLVDSFDNPERLWAKVLENQFGISEQVLLWLLVTLEPPARIQDLETAYLDADDGSGFTSFVNAFRTVEGTALSLHGPDRWVDFVNPGVQDAVISCLGAYPRILAAAIRGSQTFEQLAAIWSHASERQRSRSEFDLPRNRLDRNLRRLSRKDSSGPDELANPAIHSALRSLADPYMQRLVALSPHGVLAGLGPEQRASLLVAIARDLDYNLAADTLEELKRELFAQWERHGPFDAEGALDMVRVLVRAQTPHTAAFVAAVVSELGGYLAHDRQGAQDYKASVELRSIVESDSTLDSSATRAGLPELHQLADEYKAIWDADLERVAREGDAASARSLLDTMEELAYDFGFEGWESPRLQEVRGIVDQLEVEQAEPDDEDYRAERWADERGEESTAVDPVDDLFQTLER